MPILLLWSGLALALIYLPMTDAAPSWPRSLIKTLPLTAFASAALIAGAPPMLVAALAASALGDLALSRKGAAWFLIGITGFALAHVLYLILFLTISDAPPWAGFARQTPLALFLLGFALSAEVWLIPHVGALRWPVRGYLAAITLMGLGVLTLPLGVLTLGAGLFIASDTALALQMFRLGPDTPLSGAFGWVVWSFYVIAQALILAGAATAPA